jgi:hypothetical protein
LLSEIRHGNDTAMAELIACGRQPSCSQAPYGYSIICMHIYCWWLGMLRPQLACLLLLNIACLHFRRTPSSRNWSLSTFSRSDLERKIGMNRYLLSSCMLTGRMALLNFAHNWGVHTLYCSPNFSRVIKSRKMNVRDMQVTLARWGLLEDVSCDGRMVKKQFMLWNQLAWDRAQWRPGYIGGLFWTRSKPSVSTKAEDFLTIWATIFFFFRKSVLHGASYS